MKQICLKELELENARKEGKSPDSILKSMQELLKNASLTSNKKVLFSEIEANYTKITGNNIKNLISTRYWKQLRKNGLLII